MAEQSKENVAIDVDYLKGKYSYKQRYNHLIDKNRHITYAGPILTLKDIFSNITHLMEVYKPSPEDLNKLRSLEKVVQDIPAMKRKGITHVIVSRCLKH